MERSLQTRITVLLLAFFTVAAAVFAAFNFVQENNYPLPTDGVWWTEANGGLQAQRVLANGPAQRAGIKTGDLLTQANDRPLPRYASLVREMVRTGTYGTIHYTLIRSGVKLPEVPLILDPLDRSNNQGYRLIALIYLGISQYEIGKCTRRAKP